jgi:hypothetical protein
MREPWDGRLAEGVYGFEVGDIPDFATSLAAPVGRGRDFLGERADRLRVAEGTVGRSICRRFAIGRSVHGAGVLRRTLEVEV